MHLQAVTVRGRLSERGWLMLARDCVESIGMTCAGDPAVWSYPVDGKGGVGMTICQPMVESHLVIETWPDHDGAYINIGSCKPFSIRSMNAVIDLAGLELVATSLRNVLSLETDEVVVQ